MDEKEITEVIDFAWEVFGDLTKDTKLELQKRKRLFINKAHWKAIVLENQRREQYI